MENINSKARRENAFISIQDLVKVYDNGEKAVHNFDIDIAKNEFIVIVGPSGCGKSTTLRMIAGLEDISDGGIYLDGELLNYKPSNERKMAIVFQSYALYPQMTVYNNIAFPLTINKYPMPVIDKVLLADSEVRKILETVEFKKTGGVLYNVAHKHRVTGKRIEDIATIFNVSYEAGELLNDVFSPYLSGTIEEVSEKESEIREKAAQTIEERDKTAREQNEQNGIVLDDDFCRLNDDGTKKIEPRKYTAYEIKTRVYETAEKLDLIPYLDKLPKELSGGQMQRVALGRAIVKKVPVFLMDEPLSNLDAKLRLTMRSEIVKLHNSIGATTIYVTHDQTEAMTMATRIVVMSRGFVQQIGAPEEVYNDPNNIFVAKFIGAPSMNIFQLDYDVAGNALKYNDSKIALDNSFKPKYEKFYADATEKFSAYETDFNDKAKEEVLKILSATGEFKSGNEARKKKGLIAFIKRMIKKRKDKKIQVDKYAYEKGVLAEKLESLRAATDGTHTLTVGIRPERIKVTKATAAKKRTGITIKPTVCELLGGEYNIHFSLFGKDAVCKMDAAQKITTDDELVVSLSTDDLYIFDPATGGRIA